MKIKRVMVVCLLGYCMVLSGCVSPKRVVDYSSPHNTIHTYYQYYYDRAILGNCFYQHPGEWTGPIDKTWVDYSISEIKKSEKAGTRNYAGVLISDEAVEVVVEVTMSHPEKGNLKTKFWYLLQKDDQKWKIVEFCHIPDKNYPEYD